MDLTATAGRLLLAGQDAREVEALLPMAALLAEAQARSLHVVGLVPVPPPDSLSTGALGARHLREALEPLARQHGASLSVRVAHDPWAELALAAGEEADTLLLLDVASPISAGQVQALPCDVAFSARPAPGRLRRILLPVRGGPYAGLALRIAAALAAAHDAEITVLHASPASRLADQMYQGFLQHLRALPVVTRWLNVSGDVVQAIAGESHDHDLLIMGTVARPRPDDPPIGAVAARAVETSGIPSLVVRTRGEFPAIAVSPADSPPVDYTISVVVDKWFAENSFHAGEFAGLGRLLAMKREQGLTISLGLPTLNEAATIGKIISTMKQALMEDCPLLDEIVVIDSMSTDDTVAIAESLGVPVYQHPAILPETGAYRGKGEALWKSLAVLKGDLIAWIDTDIANIHPRFAYGILGPLIREPRLMYVKGYYQRPLRDGDQVETGEGGRVTELTARPLLNLFFPELSGLVQPLSGEYAGRRKALEAVPFFTGYGVEIGLLIDILNRFGLGAIGQVDLEERVHRNQPLSALSRMAFAIIQVVMQRVGEQRGLALMDAMQQSLKQILYGNERFQLDVQAIRDMHRPPMSTLHGSPAAPAPVPAGAGRPGQT
jgi:nucleotide-binding universal stress UspA family protein